MQDTETADNAVKHFVILATLIAFTEQHFVSGKTASR
jgi:hypothetical protein